MSRHRDPIPTLTGLGMRAAGYQFEPPSGSPGIGLWRRRWRPQASGRPRRLLLVPGFGDGPVSWLPVLWKLRPFLEESFDELLLADFPGYAGILHAETPFASMDALVAAFDTRVAAADPTALLGHSLGGWLCAGYAAGSKAQPPRRLVLVSPGGVARSPESRAEFEGKVQQLLHEGIHAWRPHLFAREPLWFRLIIPGFSRSIARPELRSFLTSFRDEHSLETRLGGIADELRLVWGAEDTLIPAVCADAWRQRLSVPPGVVFIPGIGHNPQLEAPAALAEVLRTALSPSFPT